MNHFDEMTALLYLEKQLDGDHAREVAAHAAACPGCRGLIRALENEGVWLRQALATEEEAIPARLAEAPERGSIPWGWITTLGLSAGGAYTFWSGIIEPWQAQAAQSGFTQGNLLTMLFFSGTFWKGWDAMRSLMEFLAMGTLTLLATWLLRRHWRRLTTFAVVMGALLFALALPAPAGAAETKHGDPNYTLPAGESVHTDLFVFADHAEIDGDVDGDLVVWSRVVIVNGHVKGDVLCWAQELRVNGTVDGNVRSLAQSVDITGSVGKNLMTWTSETNLDSRASVGGSVTTGGDEISLGGKVGGDLLVLAHSVDVTGTLGRDARVKADRFSIGPQAEIKGHLKYQAKHEAEMAAGAKVGSVERVIPKSTPEYEEPHFYWHHVMMWGIGFVYGLVLLLLMPGLFVDTTEACKKYLPAGGFGLLFLFATPIAAIIACCTIVGLGIGIVTLALWGLALYTSTIFVAGWLGEVLLGSKVGMGPAIARLALGLFILHVLRVLPYVGGWILFVAMFWGLGALVMTLYKRMRQQLAVASA